MGSNDQMTLLHALTPPDTPVARGRETASRCC
jgi:hypothetical protein